MNKTDIEKEVLELYPHYKNRLDYLETELNTILSGYIKNHHDLVAKRDFRPGTILRFLSCSMTIKFHMDRALDYFKNKNWDEHFVDNYTFEVMRSGKHLGNFSDIDLSIRFYLFHSFYHQLETTIRILHPLLNLPKGKGRPFDQVNAVLKCFPNDFVDCIDALRNTIHNNGYYKPFDKHPKTVTYINKPLNITFTENNKIEVGTDETLFLIRDIIKYTDLVLKHDLVKDLPFTADRN